MKRILSICMCVCMLLMTVGLKYVKATDGNGKPVPSASVPEGLVIDKSVSEVKNDGSYTITLEAYVKGKQVITPIETTMPCDIVMVLDVSGSMDYKIGDGTNNTRLQALKAAAKNFIDNVAENAKGVPGSKDPVHHKIALVKFSNIRSTNIVMNLTDVTSGKDGNEAIELKRKINSLSASGSTRADEGLEKAIDVFGTGTPPEGRKRIVILFTDGYPNDGNGFQNSIANAAISKAYTLKHTCVATVYTIGFLSNANPEAEYLGRSETKKVNRYLHYVSSNFPNATNLDNPGSNGNSKAGYYLAANSTSALNNIFTTIYGSIITGGASFELDETTIIRDIISNYFKLSDNAGEESIKVFTCEANGYSNGVPSWGEKVPYNNANIKLSDDRNTIEVSGFDFSEHWVGIITSENDGQTINPKAMKLVIEIPIVFNDTCFGGNNIPTNNNMSGIYNVSGVPIAMFPIPTVNIDINYDIESEDQTTYLGNNGDLSMLSRTVEGYIPDGYNNSFVNIKYELYTMDGIKLGEYDIESGTEVDSDPSKWNWDWKNGNEQVLLRNSTQYKLTCVVCPSEESKNGRPSAKSWAEEKMPWIYVNTCTLKISKSGWEDIDEGQSFIFNVNGSGNIIASEINMKVVILENGSVTIKGLPVGEYSITENETWSWRYKSESTPYTIELTAENHDNTANPFTINNIRNNDKWLDGNAYCSNVFDNHIIIDN